jgi:hypothetical protein
MAAKLAAWVAVEKVEENTLRGSQTGARTGRRWHTSVTYLLHKHIHNVSVLQIQIPNRFERRWSLAFVHKAHMVHLCSGTPAVGQE